METILDWYRLEKPLNLKKVFNNNNPVDCEIGFGEGDFIVKKALNEKNRNFIGIEYSKVCMRKTLRKIKMNKVNNVNLILLDASSAFELLIPESSIENIYINFPDPWPKNRHEKRRLLDKEFSLLAASRLKDKGYIHILTDHSFYRDFILEEMLHYKVFRPMFDNGYQTDLENIIETKYCRKWRNLGKEIYYILFQKVMHPFCERKIKEFKFENKLKIHSSKDKILKLLNKDLQDGNSIVKILKIINEDPDIHLITLFKDYTLFQKKEIILKKENEHYLIEIPEDIFLSKSFELLLKNLED